MHDFSNMTCVGLAISSIFPFYLVRVQAATCYEDEASQRVCPSRKVEHCPWPHKMHLAGKAIRKACGDREIGHYSEAVRAFALDSQDACIHTDFFPQK